MLVNVKTTYTLNTIIADKEYAASEIAQYLSIAKKQSEHLRVKKEDDTRIYGFNLNFALDVVGSYMSTVCEYMPHKFKFKLHPKDGNSMKLSIDCIWQDTDERVFDIRRIGRKMKELSKGVDVQV